MASKKTEYRLQYGYQAVVEVEILANDEEEAKEIGKRKLLEGITKFCSVKNLDVVYDNTQLAGIVNNDLSWGAVKA